MILKFIKEDRVINSAEKFRKLLKKLEKYNIYYEEDSEMFYYGYYDAFGWDYLSRYYIEQKFGIKLLIL